MEFLESEENIREEKKMHKEPISVCMACYYGEEYIEEQMISILEQLGADDELIIIDDHSQDKTGQIVQEMNDKRIRYVLNEKNLGVNRSFEKAIRMAKHNYVFMADQDDLWTEGRVEAMMQKLQAGVLLVSGNSTAIDGKGHRSDYELGVLLQKDSKAYRKNILRIFTGKAYYYGCAMAFRRELRKVILPFPAYIESHDLWIAMAANMLKSNAHLEKIVLKRRIHGKNASVLQRSLKEKIFSRWIFVRSYGTLLRRLLKGGI